MSLKFKLYALMTTLHCGLLVAVYLILDKLGVAFIVLEIAIMLSLAISIKLVNKALLPLNYLGLFNNILQEQQYNNRFTTTNSAELDKLLQLFNQMLQHLYRERLKVGDANGILQQLMNAIPSAIIVFDYEEKIAQLNPAAELLLKVKGEHLNGQPLAAIEHDIIAPLQSLATATPKLFSDSAGKRYRCQKSDFRDKGFTRQFIIIQELTQDLQSSEKNTYQKLIRMMSHEVNNTMAATSSLLQSCLYYAPQITESDRESYQSAMRLVIERTENLNQFMKEFANMVRLPEPNLELCNLNHILMSITQLYKSQTKQHNITIHFNSISPQHSEILADRNQIEQALINIVKNAIEAVEETATKQVFIELNQLNKSQLQLRIKDTGHGINQTTQQQLFTPFYTTKPQGQGLGLMLIREIFSAHQLHFTLTNWSVDNKVQGACFDVIFPQVENH